MLDRVKVAAGAEDGAGACRGTAGNLDAVCARRRGARLDLSERSSMMLRVYEETIRVIEMMRATVETIERRDADLGRQMRRAMSSVALNIAEACGSRGRNGQLRFHSALGSMRETRACLDVARAFGYVDSADAKALGQIDAICGSLYRLSR